MPIRESTSGPAERRLAPSSLICDFSKKKPYPVSVALTVAFGVAPTGRRLPPWLSGLVSQYSYPRRGA